MRFGVVALCLLCLVSACGSSGGAEKAPPDPDAAAERFLRDYAVEFLRRNPTVNTYLGGAGLDVSLREVDGKLRDHSDAALVEEDAWLGWIKTNLEKMRESTLSPATRIDREVALSQIGFLLHQHQGRRYQQRALDTYTAEPFRAIDWQIQGLSQTGPATYGTPEEWALVVARVKAVPAYLARARVQLAEGVKAGNTPDGRMIVRDGVATAEGNAKYFAETLPALAASRISGAGKDALVADVKSAGQTASVAFLEFRDFLGTTFFDGGPHGTLKAAFAADRFAMGEAEYNWALTNNLHLPMTAGSLFEDAMPVVDRTVRSMVNLVRQMAIKRDMKLPDNDRAAVRAMLDELSTDYPRSDEEMIGWYRDAAFRLVEFGRERGLFDVPDDYKLDVVETPLPLQASVDGASYYPAPPFKNAGVGRFYVAPTHNDVEALKNNNRASIAALSAHEGFPGHDWYYKVVTGVREKVSPVRWLTPGAVEDSSSMWEDSVSSEGWGLYAEALMGEAVDGSPNGFYRPEERLYQLHYKLYRDIRVRVDTGIHTGKMTYADAVSLFSEVRDFLPGKCTDAAALALPAKRASCAAAERAIYRYSKWPTQAITYRVGKDLIYAMREEAALRYGKAFSPKAFHLAFIAQGQIPPLYFKDELLKSLAPAPAK